jgi:energy-coupling factor transporter transmembrane protein EcfT
MILVWCGVTLTVGLLFVLCPYTNPFRSFSNWYTNKGKSCMSIYIHPCTDQARGHRNTYHEVIGFTFNPAYLSEKVDVDHFSAYVQILINEAFIIHEMISMCMTVYISEPVSHLPEANTAQKFKLPSTKVVSGAVNITAFAQSTRLTIRICAQTGCTILDIFSFGTKPDPKHAILSYISDSMRHSHYFPNHTTSSVYRKKS